MGKYFVCLAYENISNVARFVKKIERLGEVKTSLPKSIGTDTLVSDKVVGIIAESVLAQNIYEALGRTIDFDVIRENKAWFLRYKNAMQHIDDSEFQKFLTLPSMKN